MAFVTADRVRDTSTTTSTGNITVSGTAPTGFLTFSAVLSVNDTFYYAIQHQSLNEWEVGIGTYSSSNVFARTTVFSSSNAGSLVNFSAGTKDVFITVPAGRVVNVQTFDSSGTWTKPAGYAADSRVFIQAWGGGGSGGRAASVTGGGGGGGYNERWITLSSMGATETVTIGAGGASRSTNGHGTAGGNTTVGSLITAYGGGGGGGQGAGGGGGGQLSAGANGNTSSNTNPGKPLFATGVDGAGNYTYQGSSVYSMSVGSDVQDSFYHGGGGASSTATGPTRGGNSLWGGGGGGSTSTSTTGGTSIYGGNGGSASTNGTQPGGGGGASTGTTGAGGAGRVVVTIFPGAI
jgi:hypothetical protein